MKLETRTIGIEKSKKREMRMRFESAQGRFSFRVIGIRQRRIFPKISRKALLYSFGACQKNSPARAKGIENLGLENIGRFSTLKMN